MLDKYMATMGLRHIIDGTYNRLMYIKLFNDSESTRYAYVMITLYDQKTNYVHWTEGLSYSRYWAEDHLTKTNLLIQDYDHCFMGEDKAAIGDDRNVELDYFFNGRCRMACVMYLLTSELPPGSVIEDSYMRWQTCNRTTNSILYKTMQIVLRKCSTTPSRM
jgi:hypothetical protein